MALFGKRVSMLEVQNRALIKTARERAERAVLVIAIIWIGWLYCLKPGTAVRLTNGSLETSPALRAARQQPG